MTLNKAILNSHVAMALCVPVAEQKLKCLFYFTRGIINML